MPLFKKKHRNPSCHFHHIIQNGPIIIRDARPSLKSILSIQTKTHLMMPFLTQRCFKLSKVKKTHAITLGILATLGALSPGTAGEPLPPVTIEPAQNPPPSLMDKIWALPAIYKNDDNPIIQRFSFEGRLHADYVNFQGDEGHYEETEWRRFRLGASADVFQHFTLRVEMDFSGGEFDSGNLVDAYNRLTDANITWKPNESFQLKLGKISAPFTLDGSTSSKRLYTTERSTLAANFWFPTEYFVGAAAKGNVGQWSYYAGVYSSSGEDEFTSFNSGHFALISAGYQFENPSYWDSNSIQVDYVYNNPDYSGNVGTLALYHILSLSSKLEKNNAGVWSNIALASGINSENQGDLFGFSIMPFYNFNDTWQIAFRYSYVYSPDDNAVQLNRYENRAVDGNVNTAHEWYLGVNCYIYGDKLKWQNGIEYIAAYDRANDGGAHFGWGFTSAIRMYF
jgi:phosphate-selective porin OprO/OprP